MSIIQEQRNELLNRFGNKAVVLIDDNLYSVDSLSPSNVNERLFPVHPEAVERLNSTMQRHIDGNAQIFVTMLYKDQPREELIRKFWNGLIATKEFKAMPETLQLLELEQARKLGPTSRFSIGKLYDGFINHIDEEVKQRNMNYEEYETAIPWFAEHIVASCKEALRVYPGEARQYVDQFYDLNAAFDNLNKDRSGGDPYFIRVDRQVAGTMANKLYLRDSGRVQRSYGKQVYYEMFIRVQNKGNNIIPDTVTEATTITPDPWLAEKNRVVQGDSRTWQFILKNISDIITKLPKLVDPIFMGWMDQESKNVIMQNTMQKFYGNYKFDSFDATDYDASTDPRNFSLGIILMYKVCEGLGLKPERLATLQSTIKHYLHDATLTPWGAYERNSTPSGHNFTGPNGTITNMLRCYVQTARLLKVSFADLNRLLESGRKGNYAYFSCVGDDAFSLRDKDSTRESIAKENNLDGYKNQDEKIVLSDNYIHFLQHAYYYDGTHAFMGYYPVSRMVEHGLFQERADQYTGAEATAVAVIQNLNNCRFNPNQDYAIDFFMAGDEKYRLGSRIGVLNLFKEAANGRSVAETLRREWDPSYQGMTWEKFAETLQGLIKKIELRGENRT